jgi:hypothetical protein
VCLGQVRPALNPVKLILGCHRETAALINPIMVEKYPVQFMAIIERSACKLPGSIAALGRPGGVEYEQGEFHAAEIISPGGAGALTSAWSGLIVTAEGSKQVQQVYKQIVYVQVQGNRRPDIVGLATIDDAAGIKQDQS